MFYGYVCACSDISLASTIIDHSMYITVAKISYSVVSDTMPMLTLANQLPSSCWFLLAASK